MKLCLCKDNTLNFFYNEQNYFFSIKEKSKYFNASGKIEYHKGASTYYVIGQGGGGLGKQ